MGSKLKNGMLENTIAFSVLGVWLIWMPIQIAATFQLTEGKLRGAGKSHNPDQLIALNKSCIKVLSKSVPGKIYYCVGLRQVSSV